MNAMRVPLLSAMFVLIVLSNAAHADVGSSINVSVAKYEPSPAEPGQYLDVWLNVDNTGVGDSNEIFIEFPQSFPFYSDLGTSTKTSIGTIPAGGSIQKKFRFLVDPKAPQGTANLAVNYGPSGFQIQKTLEIDVRTPSGALLSVSSTSTLPDKIQPGSKAKIVLGLENLAGTAIRDVVVRIDFSSGTFSPLDSVSEKRVYQLLPDESTTLSFDVISDPSASSGVYRLPVSIVYSDASGNNYSKSGVVGVILDAPPSLELNMETKDAIRSGVASDLVFSVSNTGPSKVKFMTISLLPGDAYTVVGRSKEYLGKLDPDDFETAEFKVFVPQGTKAASFKVQLDYRDAFNMQVTETRTLSVPVYSESDLAGLGLAQQASYTTTIIIILLLIVVYYFYRRRSKKRA